MTHVESSGIAAGPRPWRVAAISFVVLALELSLIRLVPAEVKAISFFTNLLLFSSFFGLGVGCILHARRTVAWMLPAGMLLLFGFIQATRGIRIYETGSAVHYWLQAEDRGAKPLLDVPLWLAAIVAFSLASLPFVSLGQELARAMDRHARLQAYSWDIAGSLAATILFSVASYRGMPPWLVIFLVLSFWGAAFARGWGSRAAHVATGACWLALSVTPHDSAWSPYYRVEHESRANNLTIWVNSSFHQEAIRFDSTDPEYAPLAAMMAEKFGLPYRVYREHHEGRSPERVLILGAGTGNDVAIALMNGAKDVTAVEIDPVILRLGRELNGLRPYDRPEVRVVVDDGRHFLWTTRERYDLVVFGTLDSQTLLSGQANLRLENYIYTAECFRDVRDVLNDGGMTAAYYSVFKPWFLSRIYATVAQAFPGSLRLHVFHENYLFNAIVMAGKGLPSLISDPHADSLFEDGLPSTDDWPYIYLEKPTIAPLYLGVFLFVGCCILGAFLLLRRVEPGRGLHLDFFLLGAGFTLLEAAAIVRLALLFGTTWIVSAVVFASALAMIFLSNLSVMRRRAVPRRLAWVGLIASVALNAFFPVHVLLSLPALPRVVASGLLIGLPVLMAGTCFSRLFAAQGRTGDALGMNLVGAMTGGLLEYLSMLIGMRGVWLVLLAVYLGALLAALRRSSPAASEAVRA